MFFFQTKIEFLSPIRVEILFARGCLVVEHLAIFVVDNARDGERIRRDAVVFRLQIACTQHSDGQHTLGRHHHHLLFGEYGALGHVVELELQLAAAAALIDVALLHREPLLHQRLGLQRTQIDKQLAHERALRHVFVAHLKVEPLDGAVHVDVEVAVPRDVAAFAGRRRLLLAQRFALLVERTRHDERIALRIQAATLHHGNVQLGDLGAPFSHVRHLHTRREIFK
mmetsp:Transcript_607/g.870  ORF Transcript_607/g.870 Transcript_607/m.870 type:complete len:226 (-) Transcript_607:1156-1833(-)